MFRFDYSSSINCFSCSDLAFSRLQKNGTMPFLVYSLKEKSRSKLASPIIITTRPLGFAACLSKNTQTRLALLSLLR